MSLYKKCHPKNRMGSVQLKLTKHCTERSESYDFHSAGIK